MTAEPPLFYLIAGEPSGDAIGASLMRALRELRPEARFAGIGGERMAAEGIDSLVPIRELAIMGILEVLPRARRILRRVRETVADIRARQPDVVVTIDSSGFCFRITERLREDVRHPLLVHYVAPMVWAWREHRARKTARAVDHLLTLLPFEPRYFEEVGLATTYVGHPVVEGSAGSGNGPAFRARHGIASEVPLLAVLPGSRRAEVRRLLPVFRETVQRLAVKRPGLVCIVPTMDTVAAEVAEGLENWPVRAVLVRGVEEKFDGFAAADAALAASGTVTLELAMARLPTIVAYKIWTPTAWMLKRTLKVPYATLINILLDRPAIPEYLQENCTPEKLEAAVDGLFADPAKRLAQIEAGQQALSRIGLGGEWPSRRAAKRILSLLDGAVGARPLQAESPKA